MSPFQAGLLGAVQGITEFLPVSSSAHLYVVPTLLGWGYAGVAFDVALHMGTLAALLIAFWRDWWNLFTDLVGRHGPSAAAAARRALAALVVGSVPGAVAGAFLADGADALLRWLPLQAAMLLVFGFLLWWVDRRAPVRKQGMPGWRGALVVGAAQAVALVPGVSRSGITITAGRALGLSRVDAARFSFLLATPITFGAGLLKLRDLPPDLPAGPLAIAVLCSTLTGFLAIRGLLRYLARAGFLAFFAYRAALALVILLLARPTA
jgi:undecaprenyl-diphosphatase